MTFWQTFVTALSKRFYEMRYLYIFLIILECWNVAHSSSTLWFWIDVIALSVFVFVLALSYSKFDDDTKDNV